MGSTSSCLVRAVRNSIERPCPQMFFFCAREMAGRGLILLFWILLIVWVWGRWHVGLLFFYLLCCLLVCFVYPVSTLVQLTFLYTPHVYVDPCSKV